MHVTLHLTTGCNMRCNYCYSPPLRRSDMTEEIARKAVDYAAQLYPINAGIIFFGGEPLLRKDLIKSTITYCKQLESQLECRFHYKVTTNGLLLDEEFLEYSNSAGLLIALSMDGIKEAHDLHRKKVTGEGSFEILETKINLLLSYQPYANALMVISPETVSHYKQSVEYLLGKGFKYIIASLNYAGNWTDKHIRELKRQYTQMVELYERLILQQRKFYFSPFEMKLASHIKGEDIMCHRCALGIRQVSVAPDGLIYPCVQFVQDGVSNKKFNIGDVWNGINESKRDHLFQLSQEREKVCLECALKTRCNNNCSCLNWQTTGVINEISPVLCETERLLIPMVDKMGGRLFRQRAPMFIQKHYNAIYPVLSLLDDNEMD